MKTLYLDTNIIGDLKHMNLKEQRIIEFLREQFDCRFSMFHIKEFLKCPSYYQELQLDVLSLLQAKYMEQSVDSATNEPEDYFKLSNACPYNLLKNFKFDFFSRIMDLLHASIIDTIHHFHGGQPNITPKEQASTQFSDFLHLTTELENEIIDSINSLTTSDIQELEIFSNMTLRELREALSKEFANAQFEYLKSVTDLSIELENRSQEEFSNQIGSFRDSIDFRNLQLNQITPPNIVESIAVKLQNTQVFSDQTCEEIFGLSKNFRNPGQPLLTWEKIYMVYMQLNSIGYHKDEKLNEKSKVSAHLYDVQHLICGSSCSVLCTNDKNFRMKAIATYEYLGINTEVLSLPDLLEGVNLSGA